MSEIGKSSCVKVKGSMIKKKNYRRNNRTEMGERIQERLLRRNRKNWHSQVDAVHPCPYCGHELVVCMSSIQEHAALVNAANSKWVAAMRRWRFEGENKKEKPRKPAMPKRLMACMCVVNRCKSAESGKGCKICRDFVVNGASVPYDYDKMRCSCSVCQCTCDAVFRRDDWQDIYTQVQLNKKDKEKEASLNKEHAKGSGKSVIILIHTYIYSKFTMKLKFIYYYSFLLLLSD
jgi:hypothetical protein